MTRDKLKPASYWIKYLAECEDMILEDEQDLASATLSYGGRLTSATLLRGQVQKKFSAAYSSGYPTSDLAPVCQAAMRGLFVFFDLAKQQPERNIEDYFFAYDERTRYLALAILFGADRATVLRLVEAVDFWPGKDAIWEKMIAHLGVEGREPVTTVQWPEAYDSLWTCFTCPAADRPAQLKRFVDRWYKEMGRGDKAWYDNHRNKHDVYSGYWCFEAAGVARMLGIDDELLKEHPHYPYDLVHMPRA